MNKVYKVVWNASLGIWVAVSEIAKGKTKNSGGVTTESVESEQTYQTPQQGQFFNYKALSFAILTILTPSFAFAAASTGGTGSGTVISANDCSINTTNSSGTITGTTNLGAATTGTTSGDTRYSANVAVGCGATTGTEANSGILDRGNPYNNGTTANDAGIAWNSTNKSAGGSTAIGSGSTATGGLSTAVGAQAKATGVAAVAVGIASYSSGNTSLAVGRQSAAIADYAQAIGNVAAATGKGTLAIGHSATATGYRAIAIGSPDIENAASLGDGQQGNGYQTVGQTLSTGRDSIALGGGSQSLKDEGMTIGAFSGATEQGSAVVGGRGAALGQQSLSIGNGATKVESGTNTPVSLTKSLGAGTSNNKTVGARIFTVTNSISETKGNTAGTLTGTVDGVAITITQAAGTGNSTTGTVGAITGGSYNGQTLSAAQAKALYQSLGHSGSVTLGSQSIAIGTATSALANNALALGSTSLASGNGSVAIGSGSTATKTDAVSIGRGAGSSVVSGVAIGAEAKVQGDNSIALGQKSVASAQINSSFLTNVGATTQGTISVGSETDNIKRRLTNLADGAVDSDGVTVAQLK